MLSTLVFTDGACSGNPGPGGWAAIVRTPDGVVRELGGSERATTNNRMEMQAAIAALSYVAKLPEPIDLYTDSTYVIHGITEWLPGWKRKGWKRADGGDVLNKDLWQTLDAVTSGRPAGGPVEWHYVRGHSGYPGNERCDRIAVAFSLHEPIELYQGAASSYEHDLSRVPAPAPRRPGRSAGKGDGAQDRAPSSRRVPSSGGKPVYLSLVSGKLERHATWRDCEARVKGKSGARYRKAGSPDEEARILESWGIAES